MKEKKEPFRLLPGGRPNPFLASDENELDGCSLKRLYTSQRVPWANLIATGPETLMNICHNFFV